VQFEKDRNEGLKEIFVADTTVENLFDKHTFIGVFESSEEVIRV
jgi:hypothetical protein